MTKIEQFKYMESGYGSDSVVPVPWTMDNAFV